MPDPRRRGGGRGRSGRGGRIPRKGEAPGAAPGAGEAFVSFPLEISEPIRVPSLLEPSGLAETLRATAGRQRRLASGLQRRQQVDGDQFLAGLTTQASRHGEVLQRIARGMGVDLSGDGEPDAEPMTDPRDLVAVHTLSRLDWTLLEQAGYASGDREMVREVKPVLVEKQRHQQVLDAWALREAARPLFREPEE